MNRFRTLLLLILSGLFLPLTATERKTAPITLSFRLMPMKTDYVGLNSVLGIQYHITERLQTGLWLVRTRAAIVDGLMENPNHSLNSKYSLGGNLVRSFGQKRIRPYLEVALYALQLQLVEEQTSYISNRRFFSYNCMGGTGLMYLLNQHVSFELGMASGWRFARQQTVMRIEHAPVQQEIRPRYEKQINSKAVQGSSWLLKLGVNVKLSRSNP